MRDFETFSMVIMIITLVIAAYKLGKDSKNKANPPVALPTGGFS